MKFGMTLISIAILSMSIAAQALVIDLKTADQVKAEFAKPGPVVLLYHADWCGPCQAFQPTYEKLSKQMPTVRFYEMNSDHIGLKEHQGLVPYIPTAFVGSSGDDLRNRPCEILRGDRTVKAVKAEIAACLLKKQNGSPKH